MIDATTPTIVGSAATMAGTPARNVGIVAMDMYFPSTYIEQTELGTPAPAPPFMPVARSKTNTAIFLGVPAYQRRLTRPALASTRSAWASGA